MARARDGALPGGRGLPGMVPGFSAAGYRGGMLSASGGAAVVLGQGLAEGAGPEQGRYLGRRPPYGYRLADAGPHPNRAHAARGRRGWRLEPDPDAPRRRNAGRAWYEGRCRGPSRRRQRAPRWRRRWSTRPGSCRGCLSWPRDGRVRIRPCLADPARGIIGKTSQGCRRPGRRRHPAPVWRRARWRRTLSG